jgi:hypothetical protein
MICTRNYSVILLAILMVFTSCSKSLVEGFFMSDPTLKKIAKDKKEYEVQVRYTQIDRDANGQPKFKSFDYNVNPNFYFYPASTIKMPVAIIALQRLNELKKETGKNIDRNTALYHFSTRPPQDDYVVDELTGKAPTSSNYIDQIFSVSDNNASNRLFELLGAEYLNNALYKVGAFTTSHITHRVGVSGYGPGDNDYVNEVQFKDEDRELIHTVAGKKSVFNRTAKLKDQMKGKGYMNSQDSIIMTPFDFSKKNFICLNDLEGCMKRVLFPEIFPVSQRFNLTKDDYTFLRRSMSLIPRDLPYFANDTHLYDNYVKFFYDGDSTSVIPSTTKIYNKVGWAYGYLTDCSYYVDEKTNTEFMLTATIKVNKDGIFNDGVYEYDSVGLPFFRALGRVVLDYDRKRK